MQYLLSVPENLASCWNAIVPDTEDRQYLAASDPKGEKIGSGGATAWLLQKEWEVCKQSREKTRAVPIRERFHSPVLLQISNL